MEVMKFILVPSLQHMALVKTVTVLWNQEDIRALIEKFDYDDFSSTEEWQKIEKKVMEKVSFLPQPGPLKEKILGVIKPIGLEIDKWVRMYNFNIGTWNPAIVLPVELGWTPRGTLDKKKTAETLIQNETIDITERYKLACIYCSKNAVEELWGKMPESHKASFYSVEDLRLIRSYKLIIFWTYDINGELDKLNLHDSIGIHSRQCTAYEYAFDIAVLDRNIAAVQYFLSMQTPVQREESSASRCHFHIAGNSEDFDLFRFFFLLMNEEQQRITIEKNAFKLLSCFLDWPRQSLFMEMANCVGIFLNCLEYYVLFEKIVEKIRNGFKDYNYQNLFEELWMQSPTTHKKYVINRRVGDSLLRKLFQVRSKKCISLIFKDATLEEKEDIIFNGCGIDICNDLTRRKQWDFLQFFICECLSTQEKMIEFEDKCKQTFRWYQLRNLSKTKRKFLKFLDNLILLKGDKWSDTEEEYITP